MEQWYIYSKKADFAGLAKQFHISPMLVRILRNRDIEGTENIERFLHGTLEDLYDPFLMKGMQEGVRLTEHVIREGGRIRIVGDYDVDGVCSSFILKSYLQAIGAHVDVRLPDRMAEGYGMNEKMAEEAAKDAVSLIITCDNGISSVEAIRRAKELGISSIVTDHHEPPEILPPADVIIDPKQKECTYPFRELCGAGVAYKFIQAMDHVLGDHQSALLDSLLQFAGMATITDIVPLQDENRILAAAGIQRLRHTDNIGLEALLKERSVEKEHVNAGNIGYVLGPCINSAGRLRNAMIAFQLLEEQDMDRAGEIAEELSMLNEERRFLTDSQINTALEELRRQEASERGIAPILVVYLPDAHESVAGIIAGRIKDYYNRPAIVVTKSESGLKGSGRSTDCFNMIEALQKNSDLFVKYGGHAKACGFTLQPLETEEETVKHFSDALNAANSIRDEDLVKKVWIDMQLPFRFVTESFVQELELLEPFGLKNEKPLFAERNIIPENPRILGRNSNVLKMSLHDSEGYQMDGIMFGNTEELQEQYRKVAAGDPISILFYPQINEFRGQRSVQLVIYGIH